MSKLKTNTASLQSLIDKANALPEATTLDVLSNPGSASTMLEGTEMLNGEGKKVTGTIETKTSSDLTASGAIVTVPAGYYASQAAKSVTTTTLATPSIDIDSIGTILVTVNQTEGYVTAETKLSHKKMTTQAAQTITPGTSDQTIAAQTFLTGKQTIKGDANLKAENIADGISIFGVTGTHSGGIDTSDATATAADIIEGETAYVNGVKVTGTNPYEKTSTDTEVNSQAEKLAELKTILEGKAAGSGGTAVETCTVVLISNSSSYRPYYYSYTTVDDSGNITSAAVETNSATQVTLNNVVCGSVVTIYWYGGDTGLTVTNATRIASSGNKYFNAYLITASAGDTATIKNANASSGGST